MYLKGSARRIAAMSDMARMSDIALLAPQTLDDGVTEIADHLILEADPDQRAVGMLGPVRLRDVVPHGLEHLVSAEAHVGLDAHPVAHGVLSCQSGRGVPLAGLVIGRWHLDRPQEHNTGTVDGDEHGR